MSATDALAIVLVTGCGALVQTTAGFGFALLVVPVLSLFVEPRHAVVASAAIALVTSMTQAITGRADTVRPVAARLFLSALAGMPFGLTLFLLASDRVLRGAVAVAVLGAVVALAAGIDLRDAGPRLDVAAGLVSGALSTSVSVNGPPLVIALQARRLPPPAFRSTSTTVLALLGVVSTTLFAASGAFERDVIAIVGIALPAVLAGIVVGRRIRGRVAHEWFRVLVLVLLTIGAALSGTKAVTG